MFTQADLIHLVLAYAVGSCWIFLATRTSQSVGGVAGGLVAGVPSTLPLTFGFIAWNQSVGQAVQVTTSLPVAFGITCLFPVSYLVLSERGVRASLAFSFVIWFGMAFVAVILNPDDFAVSLATAAVICVAATFVVASQKVAVQPRSEQRYSTLQMLARANLGGLMVVLAVLASEVGGPVLGSIFASFPAIFSSTLFLESRRGGLDHARLMARAMFVSACLSALPYGVAVRYLFPSLGLLLGFPASCCVAVVGAAAAFLILRR